MYAYIKIMYVCEYVYKYSIQDGHFASSSLPIPSISKAAWMGFCEKQRRRWVSDVTHGVVCVTNKQHSLRGTAHTVSSRLLLAFVWSLILTVPLYISFHRKCKRVGWGLAYQYWAGGLRVGLSSLSFLANFLAWAWECLIF